ncbi:MAG: ATP-binding cassette domain-containing protein, partial [Planctomycetota bacterium]
EADAPAAKDPDSLGGEIQAEGLGHSFGDGSPGQRGDALADLSFHLKPGETLAMIGPPGSGKSTFVHLLLRLYDYQRGSIRLDGRELRELSPRFVRSRIGVVLQEPFLYSKTIHANVQLGRSGATWSEIVESATAAAIHGSGRLVPPAHAGGH